MYIFVCIVLYNLFLCLCVSVTNPHLSSDGMVSYLSELLPFLCDVDRSVSEPVVVVVVRLCSLRRFRLSREIFTSVLRRRYFSFRHRYLSSRRRFSQRTFSYRRSSPKSLIRCRSSSSSWPILSFKSAKCCCCSLRMISS